VGFERPEILRHDWHSEDAMFIEQYFVTASGLVPST
jgi:hypothetical protein